LQKTSLSNQINLFKINAPAVAKKAQPGQFVVVRVDEKGERIPLTIADWDREEGSITVVFNAIGTTTRKLAALEVDEYIANFAGPLGIPAEIDKYGTVVCVVAGYSVATIVPVIRALKEAGNKIISIIRTPSKDELFGEDRLGEFSEEVIVATGDSSCDYNGFVLEPLKELIENKGVNHVVTAGPACMMKLVAGTTRPFNIKTIASLNPIMVDGTGMCGCCRVVISGETKFACVDGPEFDAHEVDWNALMSRRCTYSGNLSRLPFYQCINCAQW